MSETTAMVPCPCTLIEQDEDCPAGYPSMLCGVCKGTGNTTQEQVTALACEMIKVASDVGEPEDPFAAWESVSLIQTQNSSLRKALKAMVHAVCGETGFANAVRVDSGTAYPWPALDIAEQEARTALDAP